MDSVALNAIGTVIGFIHVILLGRRHSAGLRSGRVNLLATGTRRAFGKSLFNNVGHYPLYLVGIGALLLLGVVSSSEPAAPDAGCVAILYEKYRLNGGMEAISNRAEMLSNSLLALSARSMAGNWRVYDVAGRRANA
ncbi:hypothetical protein KCP78_10295 [Salmonella enterica subsp. enterica]|nr:hypothetical protein KCP78_10295 [Salmonella enterica subsp. enterica]